MKKRAVPEPPLQVVNNVGFNGIGAVYFNGNDIWREGWGWVSAPIFTGAGSSREQRKGAEPTRDAPTEMPGERDCYDGEILHSASLRSE